MLVDTGHRKSATGKRHARSERIVLAFGLLIALGALLMFGWIAQEMLEGDTVRFDGQVRSSIHEHSNPQVTAVMKVLTVFGSSLVMTPLSLAVLGFCYMRGAFHALKTLLATFVGALLLELILKTAFHRPRPAPFFDLPTPRSFSFPSGHALYSFCFFAGIAVVLYPTLTRMRARVALWLVAGLLVFGIGFSRIYLGVHYPSDVLAGYAAGAVWVASVWLTNELHHKHLHQEWA
jgi:membrane-associated phospholipid phosphatase